MTSPDTNTSTDRSHAATADLDVSDATPDLVDLVVSYLGDRSSRDLDAIMTHFDRERTVYIDAVLGRQNYSFDQLRAAFAGVLPGFPPGSHSYATKVLGDATSAILFFTDEAALFGHEVNVVAALNFTSGLITRQIDYWDGRHFTVVDADKNRLPDDQFPTDFKESTVGETAAPETQRVANALGQAFAAGDGAAAATLFASDATFEDLTLHAEVFGEIAIRAYLDRALVLLPYGVGSAVRHVLGNGRAGGYEWSAAAGGAVRRGITALTIDERGLISRLSAIWDGSLVRRAAIVQMQALTIEK